MQFCSVTLLKKQNLKVQNSELFRKIVDYVNGAPLIDQIGCDRGSAFRSAFLNFGRRNQIAVSHFSIQKSCLAVTSFLHERCWCAVLYSSY